ncbi:MAG: NUDIX hydrolase [Burkholderiales bacterium]|nr:NUDIX hydrolase [Burkholderiales bacterium]
MNDQHLVEKPISSEPIFAGNFMKVMRDTVELPNGRHAFREYIKHSGAVAIFALDKDNNIVMERQYRTPVSQVMIEVPAGKIDAGEDYLTCGKRELLEETGYVSDKWDYLGEILPCIGYSTEKIVFYVARDVVFTEAKLDEGEFLEVYTQPLDELLTDAYNGKITDGKTLAGLLLLNGYLAKNK